MASDVAYGSGLGRWDSGGGGSFTCQMVTWTHQWGEGPWGPMTCGGGGGRTLTSFMSLVLEMQKKQPQEAPWDWVADIKNHLSNENGKRQSQI